MGEIDLREPSHHGARRRDLASEASELVKRKAYRVPMWQRLLDERPLQPQALPQRLGCRDYGSGTLPECHDELDFGVFNGWDWHIRSFEQSWRAIRLITRLGDCFGFDAICESALDATPCPATHEEEIGQPTKA
jgi:hypothetical protein